jgi:hypothetical protein
MTLTVREMMGSELDLISDYFQNATPEYLETLGGRSDALSSDASLARPALPRR